MHIELKNISKSFGGRLIIPSLSLQFATHSFSTILGPSGCGKTTLLRMISGLETPDTGEIWFGNRCVFNAEQSINVPPQGRDLGFVFQDFALWPHLSVFENVAFPLRARHQTKNLSERVMHALSAVQLESFASRSINELSGGQQQRVGFARALVSDPLIILFDEPLSALDALLREDMRHEIRQVTQKMGVTSVFVTHDQLEAMSMSDSIVVMNAGRIIQHDVPEAVYRHPANRFVADFVGKSNFLPNGAMFRPESSLFFAPETEDFQSFEVKFLARTYLGFGWLLEVEHAGIHWTIPSNTPGRWGTHFTIYVRNEDIIDIPKGGYSS